MLVLDTGLCTAGGGGTDVEHDRLRGMVHVHADWLSDPTVEAVDDEDEPDDDGGGFLDFEGGHGTFISGIVRQLCPDADIVTAGVLSSFGDGDVATVTAAYERVRTVAGPFDIVVMSFGGFMTDDDGRAVRSGPASPDRRRHRRGGRRQPGDVPAVLPRRAARHRGCRCPR